MIIESAERFRRYTDAETFEKIRDYGTINEMWKHCAAEYAERIAIDFAGETYTYAKLDADAAALRSAIRAAGVMPGCTVALLAANSYDFVKAYIAIVTAGCTAAVLPAHLDEMSVFGCKMKFIVIYASRSSRKRRPLSQSRGSPAPHSSPPMKKAKTKSPFARSEKRTAV